MQPTPRYKVLLSMVIVFYALFIFVVLGIQASAMSSMLHAAEAGFPASAEQSLENIAEHERVRLPADVRSYSRTRVFLLVANLLIYISLPVAVLYVYKQLKKY